MTSRSTLIKQLSREAGKLVASMSPTKGIQEKEGRGNFATAADMASEKLIMNAIRNHFPEDKILSEETGDTIKNPLSVDRLWIIDPIDGTHNFQYRMNYSAVSIGYAEKGVVKVGAIYDIFRDELYFAEKGNGAYFEKEKMHVAQKKSLDDITLITDNAYEPEVTRKALRMVSDLEPVPFTLMKGSAALDFCEIAGGKADLFFHPGPGLEPHDNAAGFLLIEEAGGVIKKLNGQRATIMDADIAAGNEKLVDVLLEQINNRSSGCGDCADGDGCCGCC